MKTSELKKIVEDNKFIFVNNECNRSIFIYKNSEEQMNYRQSSFISKENAWFGIDDNMPKVVAQAILDYAYTPLEGREEEKRYRLKVNVNNYQCLNFYTVTTDDELCEDCLAEKTYDESAEGMFEKLGYKIKDDSDSIMMTYKKGDIEIDFYISEKEYSCTEEGNMNWHFTYVNPDLHKAITQQMKELGWL